LIRSNEAWSRSTDLCTIFNSKSIWSFLSLRWCLLTRMGPHCSRESLMGNGVHLKVRKLH